MKPSLPAIERLRPGHRPLTWLAATHYGPGDTFWMTRAGARLDLRYDAAAERFIGTVTNITGATIPRVRVEVHLSNGVELGPTPTTDLAPGQTVDVELRATGQDFATWGAHAESDGSSGMAAFTPSLGAWAVVDGVGLGIEHPRHRMSAWYASQGGSWTAHLSPDPAPEHRQRGGIRSALQVLTVPFASTHPRRGGAYSLEYVPMLGTLQWSGMPVCDGRFMGSTTANSNTYAAEGQFGGAGQAGVVGHASGPAFRSVFYGEKD